MAKYNIYAVAYGVNPSSKEVVHNLKFKTWDECKPYVVGVEGAKYKGFLTDEEADKWLDKTVSDIFDNTIDVSIAEDSTLSGPLNLLFTGPDDERFARCCCRLGLSPEVVIAYLKRTFVEQQMFIDFNKRHKPKN